MRNNRKQRSLGSAWRKAKKMLGIYPKKKERKSMDKKIQKGERGHVIADRPTWHQILLWFFAWPVVLPPLLFWVFLEWNEQNVSNSNIENYEYDEVMRGNAAGSAILMLLLLLIWCFSLPQITGMIITHIFLGWSLTASFWACVVPSIAFGCLFLYICYKIILKNEV